MSLRNQPYIPLYVMDFMTDEKLANCSAESTGVFIRLMCILHKMEDYGVILLKQKEKQNESNIKNFALKLVRQMPYDVACIERSLIELADEGVIVIEGDRLYQKRMVKDNDLSTKRSEAGKKGGLKAKRDTRDNLLKQKEEKEEKFCSGKTTSKIQANSEYEIENENESEYENKIDNDADYCIGKETDRTLQELRFTAFWGAYPNKKAKQAAWKAWQKIKPTTELFERIMAAVDNAKKSEDWARDNGRYIPYPATWLNGGRWDDELTKAPPNTANAKKNGVTDTMSVLGSIIADEEGGGYNDTF